MDNLNVLASDRFRDHKTAICQFFHGSRSYIIGFLFAIATYALKRTLRVCRLHRLCYLTIVLIIWRQPKNIFGLHAAKLVKMKLKMGEKEELGFVKDFMCCFFKGAPFTHVSKDDMGLVLMNR